MAVNDVLNQLQQLIQRTAPKLIEVTDQPKELVPFVPGERYTARVEEQIANGRFLVFIRDQKLDLNLPRNTQPGQNVELRFVSGDPRLTFVLDEEATLANQTRTPVNFSDGARYLNGLLDRVKDLAQQVRQQPVNPSQAQQLTKPLFEGAPPATPQLAAALKEAVSKSGLFYESHQAQWVAGERPISDLLKEPQGKLSEPRAAQLAQSPQRADEPGGPPPARQAAEMSRPPQVETAQRNGANTAQATVAEPVHPQTAPLVQQQLDTLDTRQMVWMGQVWPGQTMQWQIEDREARSGGDEAQQEWATTLDLTLPHLGEVHAALRLTPAGLVVDLRAASSGSAQQMRGALPLLDEGMKRAEIKLAKVTVAGNG